MATIFAAPLKVWVVLSNGAYGLNAEATISGVYAHRDAAYAATLGDTGHVQEYDIDYTGAGITNSIATSAIAPSAIAPNVEKTDKPKKTKAPKTNGEASGEAKEKKPNKKEIIPEGNHGSLTGQTIAFLGSLKTMNRKTSEACAKKYGAEVTNKTDKATFTVIGTNPGDNVEDDITNAGGVTETEAGFYLRMGATFNAGDSEPPSKKYKTK